MLPGQKEQAEIVRLGLITGFRDVSDAVRWADGIIAADAAPDAEIVEVALAAGRERYHVVSLLAAVPGHFDSTVVMRRLLGEFLDMLNSETARGEQIANWLYTFAARGDLPEGDFGSEAYTLDDIFEGARAGWNSSDQAISALREYLTRNGTRA
jgi:hypothetical protein